MRQGAQNLNQGAATLNRRAPLVPKELILPTLQRLGLVLFAMCGTALGIRLYARYKLGTLGGSPNSLDRLVNPLLMNDTHLEGHFFLDISGAKGNDGSALTKQLEESGWKGVCVTPFPDSKRSCEPISMPIVAQGGDQVMVADCTRKTSSFQVVLSAFSHNSGCPQVERSGVGIKDLMKISEAPSIIDFVHLDADGSESKIIKDFPFAEFCVRAWKVNQAHPQSDIAKMLKSRNCNVLESPAGYSASCSCSGFSESVLQARANASAPTTPKREAMHSKKHRNKAQRAHQSAMAVHASAMVSDVESLQVASGGSLVRKPAA